MMQRGVLGSRPRPLGHARYKPRVTDVRQPRTSSRRCVVKAHFVRLTAATRRGAAQHLAYVERDGVNQDGSRGEFFGPAERFDRQHLVAELPAEKRQFRFIVSPEDAGELDLRIFTRALMAQMEADLGRRLIWGAVEHWDTDNPHAHIIVRGLDAAGADLTINRQYIGAGLRWRAQEIATRELGLRPEGAIERQWENEVGQERLTSIDRQLAPLVEPDGRLSLEHVAASTLGMQRAMARLATLEQLQLAGRTGVNEWGLDPGWLQALQQLGERGDIIKRLHRDVSRAVPVRIVDPERDIPAFEGIVRRKGLHDEQTGELFAAIETVSGSVEYVRLPPGANVRTGAVVRVSCEVERWVRPSDRALQELAGRNGGIYDPAAQRTELEGRPRRPDQPTPADLITGNERRLARLERYRLVERLPDGRWRIPSTLVDELEAREVSHPRKKLRIVEVAPPLQEQIRHEGPTWLDRQPAPPATAPSRAPFREELRAALEHRRKVLQSRERVPAVAAELLERERQTIGHELARVHKMRLSAVLPEALLGRVVAYETRAGRHYAAILDDATGSLAVVPVSRPSKGVVGRTVSATKGKDQRFELATPGLSRGEPS